MKVNHCEYRVLTIELSILSAPLVHRKLNNFSVAPRPQGQVHNKIDPLGPADAPGLPDPPGGATSHIVGLSSGRPLGFYQILTTKKNPNIDQILTTQHFIDQILTAKVP